LSFSFIHTADLHLDAPLRALALRDAGLAEQVGTASRQALSRIIDLCIDEQVAFLLIAGDLWDGTASTRTPRFLHQELQRLTDAGIRCCIIRGNHDPVTRSLGELDPPPGVVRFGARPGTERLELDGHVVAIHGLSFREAQAPESLLPRYPAPIPGAFNIGMMHTSLDGSPGHDRYAPCSLHDLQATGYDYWALGHIHKRSEHPGRTTVVMPGSPQGRDINEGGDRSVTLVRVSDDGSMALEQHVVAGLRFERCPIDCSGLTSRDELIDRIGTTLRDLAARPRLESHLVIRILLQGTTPLAWQVARDLDLLTPELREMTRDHGLWLDRLVNELDGRAVEAAARGRLPHDLVQGVLHDMIDDPGVLAQVEAEVQVIIKALPAELRDMLGEEGEAFSAACHDLLREGTPIVLASLDGEGGPDAA